MLRSIILPIQIVVALLTTGCDDSKSDPTSAEITVLEEWNLPEEVPESSGLLLLDGKLYTHNDTNSQTTLYELSLSNGTILNSIVYQNINLTDWEAIASDGNRLFLGDIGNNLGSRTDLKIVSFPVNELNADTPTLSTREFSYADQTDFTPANRMTPFDAEALVYHSNRLLLFTKDWLEFDTAIYDLTDPTINSVSPSQRLDIDGLVTDASVIDENRVLLVGYNSGLTPFLTILERSGNQYSISHRRQLNTVFENGGQVEGLAISDIDGNTITLYLSSERFQVSIGDENIDLPAKLYKLEWRYAE